MIRTQEATGKTVDEARAKACALLGVQADDLNVSYEVLEMPQKTGFLGLKTTPAKVRVSVEEPDAPAAPVVEEKVEPEVKPVVEETPAEEPKAEEPAAAPVAEEAAPVEEAAAPAAEDEEPEVPINIEENAKVKAAVDYLKEVIALMGVENVAFSAVQKGEATIIRLDGEKLGALIGRRGVLGRADRVEPRLSRGFQFGTAASGRNNFLHFGDHRIFVHTHSTPFTTSILILIPIIAQFQEFTLFT